MTGPGVVGRPAGSSDENPRISGKKLFSKKRRSPSRNDNFLPVYVEKNRRSFGTFTRGARLPVVGPAGAMTRNYNNSPATRVRRGGGAGREYEKRGTREEAREICQRQTQSSGNRFIRPPPPKTLLAISPRTKRPDDLF